MKTSSPAKDAVKLWFALGLTQLLSLIRSFWVSKYLMPVDYGVLGTILLLQTYTLYLHLGVIHALSREVPLELGRGNYSLAEKISRTTMTLNILLFAPLAIGYLIAALLQPDPQNALIFGVLFLLIPISRLELFADHQLRSHLHMDVISRASAIGAVITFILVIPSVYFWGLPGVLAAMLISAVYPVIHKGLGGGLVAPGWDKTIIKRIFAIGFPLFLLNFSGFLFLAADRTAILGILGKEALGYYMIGVVVANFLTLIPINLGFAFSPRILTRFGKTNDPTSLSTYLVKPFQGSAMLSGWLAGIVVICLPLLLYNLLPAYLPGLSAAMVVSIAAVMIGVASLPNEILITLGRQRVMIPLKLATLVMVGLGDWFVLTAGWGLVAVACVNLITYSIYTAWLTIWAQKLSGEKGSSLWGMVALTEVRVLAPGGLAALLLWATSTALGRDWGDGMTLAIALPAWLVLTLPWSMWLWRDGQKLLKQSEF